MKARVLFVLFIVLEDIYLFFIYKEHEEMVNMIIEAIEEFFVYLRTFFKPIPK